MKSKDSGRVTGQLSRGEQNMARSKQKSEDEEIEDLVDTLDELEEDEIEDEDVEVEEDDDEDLEDDEDDEDPDEAPKAKRSRSKKSKAAKKERTGIGTVEVADEAGITPRALRMFLRAKGYQPREDRDGRYEWASMRDPEVREILKAVKQGEAKKVAKEQIDDLKARKSAKKNTAKSKSTSKKTSARKRRAKADAEA